ncbi:MAG: preprotein translocase subunit SecG [Parvularculaceae bacterium]
MIPVLLTIHVLIVLTLIGVVLLQRSDGGALGLGGGGGGGGFMTGRGAANALTRTTSVLTALFFATSISLAILAGGGETEETVIEELTGQSAPAGNISGPGAATTGDLLNSLGAGDEDADAEAGSEATGEDTPAAVLDTLGAEPDAAGEEAPVETAPDENAEEQPGEDAPNR